MTIEEEFFKTFGIEPKIIIPYCLRCWHGTCVLSEKQCKKKNQQKCKDFKGSEIKYQYPEITDRILLELICILVQWDIDYEYLITSKCVSDLKQELLNDCIQCTKQFNENFIEQVRRLFEVEECS